MLGILREELLLQRVDAGLVALLVELGALLHGLERSPGLGINDVGVPEGFLHVVALLEAAAGGRRVLLGDLLDLGHDLIALGMGESDVHAEAGEQADDALRDGQGLAVAGGIGPGHGDLLALEVLHAAEVVDDVEHIGHALGGMVDVALEVDERRALLEDTVAVALFERVDEGLLILVALADEHIVADADDVSHEGDHVGGLTHGLAVGDLAHLLVEHLLLKTEEVAGGGEGEAGAGGIVAEDGDAEAGVEHLGVLVALAQVAQGVRHGEDRVDLLVGLVPGPVEVVLVHIVDVERFEMTRQFDSLAHGDDSPLSFLYRLLAVYLMSLPVSS